MTDPMAWSISTAAHYARVSHDTVRTPIGHDEFGNELTSFLGQLLIKFNGTTPAWKK